MVVKNSLLPSAPKREPSYLPLLTRVKDAFPFSTLDDAYVICAQHLLETSTALFHSLFHLGLSPNCFSVIGKCYSTNPSVYFALQTIERLDVCPSSQEFIFSESFDSQYEKNINNFVEKRLNRILASGCKKLIIVDDGGVLIETMNYFVKRLEKFSRISIVGIEQTSSGFAKLQTADLHFPVINVARSEIKLSLEAELIADSIFTSLQLALEEIGLYPKNVLILGKGAIGCKIEEKLRPYYEIDSYDPLKNRGSIDHFEEIEFGRYDLIIGSSGEEAIGPANYHKLRENAVLVSASSSDREFCAANLRAKLNWEPRCHNHLYVNGIYLINCGFPVNFSNHYQIVDDERYQLTRSLILAGILQACTQAILLPCFTELSPSIQRLIRKEFLSLYPRFILT